MVVPKHLVLKVDDNTCVVKLDAAFLDCDDVTKSERMTYILDQCKNYKNVIGSLTWENRDPTSWLPWIRAFHEQTFCTLIFDSVYEDYVKDFPVAKFIDFFLLRTNFELTKLESSTCNLQWNPDTNRFLFLTGKPANLNRALLLKKLIDAGLQHRFIWSLFVDEKSRASVQKILSLNDNEFEKFLSLFSFSPDNIKPSDSGNYGGFPYDSDIFKSTSFRIISETQFVDTKAWITEKTWTTIVNHHPFIMAGNAKTLEKLKYKGLKTFENYLTISNYDDIENPLERLDAIVVNARDWLQTIVKDRKSIEADVLANRQKYDQLLEKNMMIMLDICNNYNFTLEALYQSGYFSGTVDEKWLLFYNNVKDQSWPYCFSARHLYRLPLPIRQELIDIFRFDQNDFL